ncbi:DegT/DnrJ/EryC1/StrS family aminotransferase, partial [Candidatus Omnitrophota bacterium]
KTKGGSVKFTIGFEKEDTGKLHEMWDEIVETNKWSEGRFTKDFEEKWSVYNDVDSVAFSSWGGAALAALEFFNIRGKTVLCPSNTFMATPLSAIKAGANVEFVDCNKNDLCMSLEDLKEKIDKYNPAAVFIVHIGGHIAFEIGEIALLCKQKGIVLLEDCAHAHGASWNGKKAGTWGDAGIYSFYATKTISTGEGGMLVSNNAALIEFAKKYRNYGKFEYDVEGLNYRMSEFTAAIGCVQTERLNDIVAWKNEYARENLDPLYPNRVKFPDGMISGYYKYIVFDEIEKSTGKVYDQLCHEIMGKDYDLPNAGWIAKNHWCVPLYYKGDVEQSAVLLASAEKEKV